MAVNNETGSVNDIAALVRIIKDSGKPVHLHCDAVQACGKIPTDFSACDSAAISAHKLGGPRGLGLLYLRKSLYPLIRGGHQENGIRPGTENTAGAAAMASCLEAHAAPDIVREAYSAAAGRMKKLLARLRENSAFTPLPFDRLDEDERFSPWILQAAFKGIGGEVMQRALDEEGFAVSTGSACSSADKKRPVLEAMGIDSETAFSGIRISQGWSTTDEDIEALAETIGRLCQTL
jgi:cysteine desulfurase